VFCSNEEPRRGLEPLRIDLIENRFEYLSGKALLKEEKVLQHYRHIPMKADANQMLTGLGTGQGTWGTSNLLLTKLTTVPTPAPIRRDAPVLPANLETFVKAIELLAEQRSCEVGLIGLGRGDSRAAVSSTTIPTANTKPKSDKLLIDAPSAARMEKVPMRETGMATTGMIVARQFCRNMYTTPTTSRIAMKIVLITSSNDLVGARQTSKRRELPDGYAFQINSGQIGTGQLAEWVKLERRCCLFFGFEVRWDRQKGSVWLCI
jgi:hypothetical protein